MARILTFLLFLLVAMSSIATAETSFDARVVNVLAGDVLIVSLDRQAQIVRLSGVECPVRGEAGWLQMREVTRGMVLHKAIRIEPVGAQRAGMIWARVFIGDQCLNDALNEALFSIEGHTKP